MTKKQIAQDFLKLASSGSVREAFRLYVSKNFKHHNIYFKGDGHSLMVAMEEASIKNPNTVLKVHHALEDQDCVAIHSFVQHKETDTGFAVVHLFRFESDKIVELWDLGQVIPTETINENGMF